MIAQTINNFLIYFFIVWVSNILLNFLYVIKRYFPKTKNFDKPIDGGLKYGKDRLVGESTTVVGIILSFTFSIFLFFITESFVWASIPILVYIGHTLGSIIKRRMHKKDGEFLPVVDHGDYMILTGVVFLLFGYISFTFFILSIFINFVLHPFACFIAFKLKLRENPY